MRGSEGMEPKRRTPSMLPQSQFQSGERRRPDSIAPAEAEEKRTMSGAQRIVLEDAPEARFDSFPPSILPRAPDTEDMADSFDVEGFVSEMPSTVPPPPEALFGQAREQHIADMRALFAQGMIDQALAIAQGLLQRDPFDAYAREYVTTCLLSMLGPKGMLRVPVLRVHGNDLAALPLDPRSAFVLMHVDGVSTVEMITEVCAMPEHEALRLIVMMRDMGVITLE